MLVHAAACKGSLSAQLQSLGTLHAALQTWMVLHDTVSKKLQVDGNSSGHCFLMALNRSYTSLLKNFSNAAEYSSLS